MRVRKLILSGTPDDDRGRLEEFCQLLAGTEHAAGARLRALAVELARLGGLEVTAVAYEDESLELEVVLAGDPLREPVSVGRDKTGGQCQVSWERWAPIGDDGSAGPLARGHVDTATSDRPAARSSSLAFLPGPSGCVPAI